MLVIVGIDANDQLFLLTVAIFEGENNDSRAYFIACIWARVMQLRDLCITSDRHRGIPIVMKDDYLGLDLGRAHHPFCIRHLASNFHSMFHD